MAIHLLILSTHIIILARQKCWCISVDNFTCTHIDTFTWCSCIILCLRIQRARGQSSENVSICFCLNNAACSLCYRRLIKTHRRGTLSSKALSSFCIYILVEVLCSNLRKRRPRKSIVGKKENTFFRAMRRRAMATAGESRSADQCKIALFFSINRFTFARSEPVQENIFILLSFKCLWAETSVNSPLRSDCTFSFHTIEIGFSEYLFVKER